MLHPDLPAVIREVLGRAEQPLNLAKLRSQLSGPYKVPAKLKDALVALLDADSGIYQWPAATAKAGPRYWTRNAREWAEPVIIAAAADSPVAATKVLGAVSKQYGKGAAEALLAELIGQGTLIRVPLFGGPKAKLCSRIPDEAAFRAELDAARVVIEAGYRRLGGPLPDGRGSVRDELVGDEPVGDEVVLEALGMAEPRKGLLVTAPRIYRALPEVAKAEIDAALLRLQEARRVILHRHSNPQSLSDEERQSLIQDVAGNYYVGACWRVQEG